MYILSLSDVAHLTELNDPCSSCFSAKESEESTHWTNNYLRSAMFYVEKFLKFTWRKIKVEKMLKITQRDF